MCALPNAAPLGNPKARGNYSMVPVNPVSIQASTSMLVAVAADVRRRRTRARPALSTQPFIAVRSPGVRRSGVQSAWRRQDEMGTHSGPLQWPHSAWPQQNTRLTWAQWRQTLQYGLALEGPSSGVHRAIR